MLHVVTIPIRTECQGLGDSRSIALRQFHQLEKRLNAKSELRQKYTDYMREYLDLGYMRLASPIIDKKWTYYIPHHAVEKKFRVVFNASCKTTSGESLNSIQMVGEKLQFDLMDQILRFRLLLMYAKCTIK